MTPGRLFWQALSLVALVSTVCTIVGVIVACVVDGLNRRWTRAEIRWKQRYPPLTVQHERLRRLAMEEEEKS